MSQLLFVTKNKDKILEINKLINNTIKLLSLEDINFTNDIEETENTLEGNALLKARTIFTKTNINCFADDSGLLVDALNGEPGVYSARYAGDQKNDEDNISKLLTNLEHIKNRSAQLKTVLALIIDGKEHLFEGIIKGSISFVRKGTEGFGYDSVFIPDGFTKSFAEMSLEEKSEISHRALAFKKMVEFLNSKEN